MTRKEFFEGQRTWKGTNLRAAVSLHARRVPYKEQMFHLGIGQTSPVKHFTMACGMGERAQALAARLSTR